MRVLAAMSGGVDSAVAAARCVDAGHEVVGVHLALSRIAADVPRGRPAAAARSRTPATRGGSPTCSGSRSTSGTSRAVRARRRRRLRRRVRRRPHAEPVPALQRADQVRRRCWTGRWRWGSTPWHRALRADRRGADGGASCTGRSTRQGPVLRARRARRASSSPRALFPLGDSTKREVRAEAAERGLLGGRRSPTATTSASSPTATPRAWLTRPARGSGRASIVDAVTGEVVGAHDGAYGFTVGQRRGLGLGRSAPTAGRATSCRSTPRRTGWSSARRTCSGSAASRGSACAGAGRRRRGSARGGPGAGARRGGARHRAGRPHRGRVRVVLDQPLRGVAPGQSVVLYDGTRVVGSATISGTAPA